MANVKNILNRLLEEARLNEEEELDPEVSKTENSENATIPDEATEVKPVDAKEEDLVDNENDVDVKLTESEDEDKEEKSEDKEDDEKEEDKKEDEKEDDDSDDKEEESEKSDDDDDKEDDEKEDDEKEDGDDKKLNEDILTELFEKWRAQRQRNKAQSHTDAANEHNTARNRANTQGRDANRAAGNFNASAARKAADGKTDEAVADRRAAAAERKKEVKANRTEAVANELKTKEEAKARVHENKAKILDAKAKIREAKKGKNLDENAMVKKLFDMFMEELTADSDVESATDDFNNAIPEYTDQPVAPEVEVTDILDTAGDVTKEEEDIHMNESYQWFKKELFNMLREAEELDPEESKTDNPENATIPDEATEVKPVDAKEDDFIENKNDEDVELTEEVLNELFDKLRAKYHGHRAKVNEDKAKKQATRQTDKQTAADSATRKAEHHRNAARGASDAASASENNKVADMYDKVHEKDQTAARVAGAKNEFHNGKKDYHQDKAATLNSQIKAKAKTKSIAKAIKQARKRGVSYDDIEESQIFELFNLFLEELDPQLAEELLDGNNPEVEAAAETEGKDPQEVLDQAEADTTVDTEKALYQLNDNEINESINNIFKYLKEEGLVLDPEESKTDNPENATIPDEATEVKPVDAKEDDFIENKNDEDVELTESKKIRSLREAYAVDPGYYSRDSKQLVTSKDKIASLTESLAFIEAKNSNDYLFEELLRAANKVEVLRESILEKYGEEASTKANKIAKLTK